jgi:NADH:ubiquinone oxidoreductase subunit 3 (subunit A)
MSDFFLIPPFAFVIYLVLAAILSGMGRLTAEPSRPNPLKSSIYTGGELPSTQVAAPGYRPFFQAALFFAILHLGVLVVSTGGMGIITAIYLLGLMLALLALILG